MSPFDLVAPATPEEAVAALRAGPPGETLLIAGGTDLLLDVDAGRARPRTVVSLRRLPWRTLDWNGPVLTIGSTLSLRALELDPGVRARHPGLYQAVHAVGSVALRHRATLGGNLGRSAPASDLIPMLLALEADVDLVGPAGERTLPLDKFVRASRATALAPHEIIRSVRLPETRPSSYLWQRVRPANDISQIAVAVSYSPTSRRWTVAVGGVPPRPVLLPGVGAALGPVAPDPAQVRRAAESAGRDLALTTDRRASEEYRRHLVGTLLRRAVAAVTAQEGFPR